MKIVPIYADTAISGKALYNLLLHRGVPARLIDKKEHLFKLLQSEPTDMIIFDVSSLNCVKQQELQTLYLISPSLSLVLLSPYREHEQELASCRGKQYYHFEKPVEFDALLNLIKNIGDLPLHPVI